MKRTVSLALAFGVASAGLGSRACASSGDEAQLGAQVYRDLAKKGSIVATSPWYGLLNAMGQKIALVADRQYAFGFRFFLVNEKQPNAFAVPGGNIYVTVPMMTFVKTKEELAGVLCHEVAHDIHHDVPQLNQKAQTTNAIAAGLSLLIGGGKNAAVGTVLGVGAKLQGMHYSRAVETKADVAGAKICAQAGYNPWGMVWLFQAFSRANAGGSFEMLSDHPNDANRISTLEAVFRENPKIFGRFSAKRATGNPMPSLTTATQAYGSAKPRVPAKRAGY